MLSTLHWLVLALYVTAPCAVGVVAVAQSMKGKPIALFRWITSVLVGATVAMAGLVLYARLTEGRWNAGQLALAIYFCTAMVLALRALDALLVRVGQWIVKKTGHSPRPIIRTVVLPVMGLALRGLLVIAIGLPYILSSLLIYRPRVQTFQDPLTQLKLSFTPVQFESTDGLSLSGWWMPAVDARQGRRSRRAALPGKTVILCHGLAGSKAHQLALVRKLVPAGYNALAFDFRAHGQSAGQLTSLGDLERRDVLGAVRWLRSNHPEQSRRIVGIGVNTGAAALIAAAADSCDEGQAIEALAVYGAFDDLAEVVHDTSRTGFTAPMGWLAPKLGLPMASMCVGTNLARFKPSSLVDDIWPRPILVIHGTHDQIVPFEHGRSLFEAASFPKQQLWLPMQDHNDAMADDEAADAVRLFFDTARPISAI